MVLAALPVQGSIELGQERGVVVEQIADAEEVLCQVEDRSVDLRPRQPCLCDVTDPEA
jgi:hypothetical protein